jgi:DnaK suppressor protein
VIDKSSVAARLRDMLAALEAELAGAEGNAAPVTLDQEAVGRISRIDAMQVQAMALATEARRRQRRLVIEAALLRLEGDDYGWCLGCGEAIEPARLDNDPAVTLCLECANTARSR